MRCSSSFKTCFRRSLWSILSRAQGHVGAKSSCYHRNSTLAGGWRRKCGEEIFRVFFFRLAGSRFFVETLQSKQNSARYITLESFRFDSSATTRLESTRLETNAKLNTWNESFSRNKEKGHVNECCF